jgi:AraC-like DNA-binding protein
MPLLIREPPLPLRSFIKTLWVGRDTADETAEVGTTRERMLPSGAMHLVLRLAGPPIRLFRDVADRVGVDLGHAVVGGMRTGFYLRDKAPAHVIGIELRPGMDARLLGASAAELAERHTPLEDLWGRAARELRERLVEPSTLAEQLELFASLLARRFAPVRAMHPAVAHALTCIQRVPDVGGIVRASGYSHRRFIALFRDAVGISPKRYQRVLRFERSLRLLLADPTAPMVDVALAAGYSDQPHFHREFREFAGISPTEYRQTSPVWTQHVPVPSDEVNSVQDRGGRSRLETRIVGRERRPS